MTIQCSVLMPWVVPLGPHPNAVPGLSCAYVGDGACLVHATWEKRVDDLGCEVSPAHLEKWIVFGVLDLRVPEAAVVFGGMLQPTVQSVQHLTLDSASARHHSNPVVASLRGSGGVP